MGRTTSIKAPEHILVWFDGKPVEYRRVEPLPRRGVPPGTRLPPLYREPGTGRTWAGRGLQPAWVRNLLAQGVTLDQLRVLREPPKK